MVRFLYAYPPLFGLILAFSCDERDNILVASLALFEPGDVHCFIVNWSSSDPDRSIEPFVKIFRIPRRVDQLFISQFINFLLKLAFSCVNDCLSSMGLVAAIQAIKNGATCKAKNPPC